MFPFKSCSISFKEGFVLANITYWPVGLMPDAFSLGCFLSKWFWLVINVFSQSFCCRISISSTMWNKGDPFYDRKQNGKKIKISKYIRETTYKKQYWDRSSIADINAVINSLLLLFSSFHSRQKYGSFCVFVDFWKVDNPSLWCKNSFCMPKKKKSS